MQPFGKITLEPGRRDYGIHLRPDSPHFGQAQRVNILCRKIGRGVVTEQEIVVGPAIRNRRDAEFLPRRLAIRTVDIAQHGALRGPNFVYDQAAGLCRDRRERRQRFDHRVFFRRARDLLAQNRHGDIGNQFRVSPPCLHAAFQVRPLLREICRYPAHPRQPRARLIFVLKIAPASHGIRCVVESFVGHEGETALVEIDALDPPADQRTQMIAIDAVFLLQRAIGQPIERIRQPFQFGPAPCHVFWRFRRPPFA